jgi:2-amino-4-hydroxy-6-hydroxymethyldihydropteridine diphosphokinase
LNSVVRVVTQLAPIELLKRLLAIEASLGRTREIRWDRRVIDLDILLYGGLVLSLCNLALPHPRLHERRFVLEPLSDIAADVMHPTLGKTVSQMAAELREGSSGESVVRVAGPVWRFEPMDVNAR